MCETSSHSGTQETEIYSTRLKAIQIQRVMLSDKGFSPDMDKMKAIREFPVPQDVSSLRSWISMIQQFQKWNKGLTAAYTHMRSLLVTNRQYVWTPEMDT